MPTLNHPRLTSWAAELIQGPVKSRQFVRRFLRQRLQLGTQMTDVEADVYERGIWFFGILAIPVTLMGAILIGAMMFTLTNPDKTHTLFGIHDYLYGFIIGPIFLIAGITPLVFVSTPLIGRHAAEKYNISPQPYESWTEQIFRQIIFRSYLKHIYKHRQWNPLYRLFYHFARTGAIYYKMEGHSHGNLPLFSTYSYYRVSAPVALFGTWLFIFLLYTTISADDSLSWVDVAIPIFFSVLGFGVMHVFIGKQHGDLIPIQESPNKSIMTRDLALKTAIYGGIGGLIGINFHHIKSWVLMWL